MRLTARPAVRRARAQAGLLAAVAALVLLAATAAGTAAQLLTAGQDAALAAALGQAPVEQVRAVARLDLLPAGGAQQQRALDGAAAVLARSSAPVAATTSTAWTASARYVDAGAPAADRDLRQGPLALLGTLDGAPSGLAAHADLVQGRWPVPTAGGADPLEVVVPVAGATGRLALGARAVLAPAPGDDPSAQPTAVLVVGTYAARTADPVWLLDPLRGAGSATGVEVPGTSGRIRLPAVGPLLTAPGQLLRGGVLAASGGALAVPRLAGASPSDARAVAAARGPSTDDVEGAAAGASAAVVDAALPRFLQRAGAQQVTTAAGVLVGAVAVAVTAVLALAAAAQLLEERRRAERELLVVRGASSRQLLRRDAAEASVVAALAGLLALPASALASSLLLRQVLPSARPAALGARPWAPPGTADVAASLPAVAGTAAVAVVVLLLVARGPSRAGAERPEPGRRRSRGAVARSGADVLLLAVTAAGWSQLHTTVTGRGADALSVAVPALALLATALLGVRATVLARRLAERLATRSRGAPRAVAAWALAREPLAAGTAALLVLAPATAASALVWRGAWSASVQQQVDARLGTALTVLPPSDGADPATASALARATGGDPAPVSVLPVGLGTRAGSGPVQLVAVPAARTAELLLTGPPAAPAPAEVAALAAGAGAAAAEPALPAGTGPLQVRVSGTGAADGGLAQLVRVPPLRVLPSLVVSDGWGATAVLDGTAVVLDGAVHEVAVPGPERTGPGSPGALRVVGVQLRVLPALTGEGGVDVDQRLDVSLDVPAVPVGTSGGAAGGSQPWSATAPAGGAVAEPSARLTAGADGARVQLSVLARPAGLQDVGDVVRAASAPPPRALPVLVSAELATQVGASRGQELSVAVEGLQLPARVAGVVPVVPVAPGEAALLVDSGALRAALLAQGVVPEAQRWWVGGVAPAGLDAAARGVERAGLGTAVVEAQAVSDARHDPLAAGLRAAWLLLLAAAASSALAGAALLVAAAAPSDAATSSRLAVLGVPPAQRSGALLAPRAAQVLLGGAAGALLGTGAAAVVVPELLRAPDGGPAVPATGPLQALSALLAGPGFALHLATGAVLALLALAPLVVGAAVARRRRGDLR